MNIPWRMADTALAIGADALRANPLRTLLSTSGVVVGVASLVAVLSLGDGMQVAARSQLERITDVQTVSLTPKTAEEIDGQWQPVHNYPVFTAADAEQAEAATGAAGMSLVVRAAVNIDYPRSGQRRSTAVAGLLARADEFHHMVVAGGRFFTGIEVEKGAAVVVLSNKLAKDLAGGADALSAIGEAVRVNAVPMTVIGVLASYDGETGYDAYVPFAESRRVFPAVESPRPTTIMLRASSVENVEQLKAAAQDWAAQHYMAQLRKIEIQTQKARVQQAEQGILIFKLFMAALTGISLLVGGIGIMNVLLASVAERTREIGVRKAMGARSRDILFQFLAESVAISGAGSVLGALLGLATAFGVTAIIRSQANAPFFRAGFSWTTVVVAIGSAVFVGLVFGTYPARRAAHMSPIDAIRHE